MAAIRSVLPSCVTEAGNAPFNPAEISLNSAYTHKINVCYEFAKKKWGEKKKNKLPVLK